MGDRHFTYTTIQRFSSVLFEHYCPSLPTTLLSYTVCAGKWLNTVPVSFLKTTSDTIPKYYTDDHKAETAPPEVCNLHYRNLTFLPLCYTAVHIAKRRIARRFLNLFVYLFVCFHICIHFVEIPCGIRCFADHYVDDLKKTAGDDGSRGFRIAPA